MGKPLQKESIIRHRKFISKNMFTLKEDDDEVRLELHFKTQNSSSLWTPKKVSIERYSRQNESANEPADNHRNISRFS